MGSGVSYESPSPEPDSSDPTELAKIILDQKPLKLVQMLRLSRIINDCGPEEKLQFYHTGVIKKIVDLLSDLHHGPQFPSIDDLAQKEKEQAKLKKSKSKAGKSDPKPEKYPQHVRGIGYGSGSTKSHWNMERTVETRLQREEHMIWLLNCLSAYLFKASPDYAYPDNVLQKFQASLPVHISETGIEEVVTESDLILIIRANLVNDSLLDISHHLEMYQAVFELVCCLAVYSNLLPYLLKATEDKKSVLDMIRIFRRSLLTYTSTAANHISSPDFRLMDFILKVDVWLELLERANSIYRRGVHRSSSVPSMFSEDPVTAMPKHSTKSLDNESIQQNESNEIQSTSTSSNSTHVDKDALYTEQMKELQLTQWKFIGDFGKLTVNYAFRKEVRNINPFSPALKDRAKRIAKELACLPHSLPLSCSSSIFVCVDEGRCDIMKVLISGPTGTPYEMGLFEFDIFFPSNYPMNPPKVSFVTTGGGHVRFNPNLYPDGKVCLSILGTWEGRPEEKWSPHCTLLQLLVSIQALIFVREPYYNEPGLERFIGSSSAVTDYSNKYNLQIQHAAIKWAIKAQLETPPPYFKTIIYRHFYLLRGAVIEVANRWLTQYQKAIQTALQNKGEKKKKQETDILDYGPVFVQGMDKPLNDLIKILLMHNKDGEDKKVSTSQHTT